jgi:hypothetical protein
VYHIDLVSLELAAEDFAVDHVFAATERDDIDLVFLERSCFHAKRKGEKK